MHATGACGTTADGTLWDNRGRYWHNCTTRAPPKNGIFSNYSVDDAIVSLNKTLCLVNFPTFACHIYSVNIDSPVCSIIVRQFHFSPQFDSYSKFWENLPTFSVLCWSWAAPPWFQWLYTFLGKSPFRETPPPLFWIRALRTSWACLLKIFPFFNMTVRSERGMVPHLFSHPKFSSHKYNTCISLF